jgi:hypothetical protein
MGTERKFGVSISLVWCQSILDRCVPEMLFFWTIRPLDDVSLVRNVPLTTCPPPPPPNEQSHGSFIPVSCASQYAGQLISWVKLLYIVRNVPPIFKGLFEHIFPYQQKMVIICVPVEHHFQCLSDVTIRPWYGQNWEAWVREHSSIGYIIHGTFPPGTECHGMMVLMVNCPTVHAGSGI